MMNTFCAASELKMSLQRPGCPQILQQCIPVLEACFPDRKQGTLMHDIQALAVPADEGVTDTKTVELARDIREAYTRLTRRHDSKFLEHQRYTVRGAEFATRHTSQRNSTIFYRPSGAPDWVPGVIRTIFSPVGSNETVFFAVHRHSPACWQAGEKDPFAAFPDFGAGIWSKATQDEVEFVLSTQQVYAAYLRTWDADRLVMKPIIEVRL
jgi:hypothetical protein